MGITIKELYDNGLENVYDTLETRWTVQRGGHYEGELERPLPPIDEFYYEFDRLIDDPWDDIDDEDDYTRASLDALEKEYKQKILAKYQEVRKLRVDFDATVDTFCDVLIHKIRAYNTEGYRLGIRKGLNVDDDTRAEVISNFLDDLLHLDTSQWTVSKLRNEIETNTHLHHGKK